MEEAFSRALAHMRRSDEKSEWGEILRMLALVYWAGPMPVDRAIEKCKGVLRLGEGYGAVEVSTRAKIAALEAMRGRFDVARGLYRRSKEIAEELGLRLQLAGVGNYSGSIEMLAGDLGAAERELRAACGTFEALGETATLSTSAAFLARTLEAQGRLDEAERFTTLSAETASADDLASQFIWRGVRARVLARRGELERAELLAREAVALAATTDFLSLRGETLLDMAEVLRLAGDDAASASAVEEALRLFETKGNIVLAKRTQALLENLALAKRPA
jgi:tetratricopeptide (TPR) repeat protein